MLIAIINLVTLHMLVEGKNGRGSAEAQGGNGNGSILHVAVRNSAAASLAHAVRTSQCLTDLVGEQHLAVVLARRYLQHLSLSPFCQTECGLSHIHRADAEGCISLSRVGRARTFLGCQRT